ncbi:hypothetical protein [Nannocystis pusilla]|uniref:hypothetical protein n=1 Tax=Nannocystis pusilla TaxID=889268 RepID=UPI003BF009A2
MSVLRAFTHPDGKRRVLLVEHGPGRFGFDEERLSDVPEEQCWIPFGRYAFNICDSLETAEREARGRVEWLSELGEDAEFTDIADESLFQ